MGEHAGQELYARAAGAGGSIFGAFSGGLSAFNEREHAPDDKPKGVAFVGTGNVGAGECAFQVSKDGGEGRPFWVFFLPCSTLRS